MKQSLKTYNTFSVESETSHLSLITDIADVEALRKQSFFDASDYLMIGAGSNLLLLDECPSTVIAMRKEGICYKPKSNGDVIATVAAGVDWHALVQDTLKYGLSGLENLALIPGLVGAAPIQNIGAYGVELCDRFLSLYAINIKTGEQRVFHKDECQFAYRDSIFKQGDGKDFLVLSVSLILNRKETINIKYKALSDAFLSSSDSANQPITPMMVFEKVCEIRQSRLPDPAKLGNAGSFFKNPVINDLLYQKLLEQFPDLIAYVQPNNCWKLAAGWMIQKAGLKGYRKGNVGVHVDQALVLINYGEASGNELASLAQFVQYEVNELFGITLEAEVTIIGSSGVIALEDIPRWN